MEIKENIRTELETLRKKILILNKTSGKLDNDERMEYNKYVRDIEILWKLYEERYEEYEFLLRYIFIDKCYYGIEISKNISNIYMKDLYIIDNLHDFEAATRTGGTTRTDIIKDIRLILSGYLSLEVNNKIVRKKKLRDKEIVSVVNVNTNKNVKDYIYGKYGMSGVIISKSILPKYRENIIDKIYFESKGLYEISDMICPYKKILDGLDCKKDTGDIREKLRMDNVVIDIENYVLDNIKFIFSGNNVKGLIGEIELYKPFMRKVVDKNIDSITIGDEEYVIENEVGSIYEVIKNLNEKDIVKDKLKKYILAGAYLKRIGDYSQVLVFMKSNIMYFQTVDTYCFLYACIICELYKVIILDNKAIFTRIMHNGIKYNVYCNVPNDGLINRIKARLLEMIKSSKIKGGSVDVMNQKVEEDIFKNMKRKKYYMERTKEIKYDRVYYVNEIVNNIDDAMYIYLLMKSNMEVYRNIYGDELEDIMNMMALYKKFTNNIEPNNLDYIRELYERVIRLKEIKDELPMEERKYVEVMEIIYNRIIKNVGKYNFLSYVFLFDCISYFENYDDIDFNAEDLADILEERYNENYMEDCDCGLKVNPKYEKELKEYNEIYEKIIEGELEYTDEEYEEFEKKYKYLNDVAYITEPSDDGNKSKEEIVKDKTEKKRYMEDTLKFYEKYVKYKLKYKKLKEELEK